jgi:hypothetical protein
MEWFLRISLKIIKCTIPWHRKKMMGSLRKQLCKNKQPALSKESDGEF